MTHPLTDEKEPALIAPQPVRRLSAQRTTWMLVAALILPIIVHGYAWELGAENQPLQIPVIERLADPSLYPNDYLVGALGEYRSVFFPVVARLERWIPIPDQYLILHLLTTAAVAAAMFALARLLTGSRAAAVIASAVLLLSPTIRPSPFGLDTSVAAWVTPTTVSFPILLVALHALLAGRSGRAGILTGLASLVNPVTAGIFLMIALPVAVTEPQGWRRARNLALGFALAGLPSLLVLPPHAIIRGRGLEFLELLHRYYPYHFWGGAHAPGEYLRFAILITAAAAGFRALPDRPEVRRARRALIAIAAILALGILLVDVFPVAAAAQLHLKRADRWFMVLLFAAAGGVITHAASSRGRWRLAAAVALLAGFLRGAYPLMAWGALVLLLPQDEDGRLRPISILIAFAAAVGAFERMIEPCCTLSNGLLVAIVAFALLASPAIAAALRPRRFLVGAAAIALLELSLRNGTLGAHGLDLARPVLHPDWREVQEWAAESTPVGAVFLTPPEYAGFRVYARRGTVIEHKDGAAMLWNPGFGREWWDRTARVSAAMVSGDASTLLETARRYGAGWMVVPAEHAPPRLTPVFENQRFKVYRVAGSGQGKPEVAPAAARGR